MSLFNITYLIIALGLAIDDTRMRHKFFKDNKLVVDRLDVISNGIISSVIGICWPIVASVRIWKLSRLITLKLSK